MMLGVDFEIMRPQLLGGTMAALLDEFLGSSVRDFTNNYNPKKLQRKGWVF